MNRTTVATALLLAALTLTACKKKEEAAADKPEPTDPVAKPTELPAEPPKPVAAIYSPEAAKKAIGEMAACSSTSSCDAYKTLVGFGATAAPDLLAFVADKSASTDARGMAAEALAEIKAPDAGPKLVEIANGVGDEGMLQGDLYEAAGKSGGQATFDALIAEYVKAIASTDDNRDIPLRKGLRGFPAESVAWVKENLPKAKADHSSYTDLITDSAKAADLPTIVELLGATKDVMARNRLAAKAIELGDKAHFDVFVTGLSSKDVYDRSDSANFLAKVAEHAPADLKPKLVELLTKGKAGDAGGMTAGGYDEALQKLGAP